MMKSLQNTAITKHPQHVCPPPQQCLLICNVCCEIPLYICTLCTQYSCTALVPSAQYLLVSIVVTMFVELLFLISGVLLTTDSAVMTEAGVEKIFNFNSESDFSNEDIQAWYESSDTVRLVYFILIRGDILSSYILCSS